MRASLIVDSATFRLDDGHRALVAQTSAGDVLFRFYDDGLHAHLYGFTVRGEDYSGSGSYSGPYQFSVTDIRCCNWRTGKVTDATRRFINEAVTALLEHASHAGLISALEHASKVWRERDTLKRLANERAELVTRLAEIDSETTAATARLAALGAT